MVESIDYKTTSFEEAVPPMDVVIDTVGGDTRERSFEIIKPSGMLVSVVSKPLPERHQSTGARRLFSRGGDHGAAGDDHRLVQSGHVDGPSRNRPAIGAGAYDARNAGPRAA
jgi:NADPH:quinone reductase-like Zn-dependent oxidoreductase